MKYKKVLMAAGILAFSTAIYAEAKQAKPSKAESMIKFRQSAMMFMRWNVGKIKKQVENSKSFNKDQVFASANAIAAIANSGLPKLFKTETATGKGWKQTRVRPEFFQQPDKVKGKFNTFIKEANKLLDVSRSGKAEDVKAQFKVMFNACRSCHKDYRS